MQVTEKQDSKIDKSIKSMEYKGFIIYLNAHNKKYCAYDWRTDYHINAVHNSKDSVKKQIDELQKDMESMNYYYV